LSGEPLQVDPRLVISGKRVIEGFWLGHWMRQQSILKSLAHFREITKLIRAGVLESEVGTHFPLDQIAAAVKEADSIGRGGKVILRIEPGRLQG
jgi:NADPH:quinone reductase-like Zn-dependent oxidoreductase